ncbi:MAG: benzoyl-CoA-dihydrodiol lyase [Actinobacteria bacterium]|nr:benzoyl-CoA-dihydrodiol lyase [Actinomycetota bacterium]
MAHDEPTGIDFRVDPSSYNHWRLSVAGPVATLTMDVDPDAGSRDDYQLKTNSYDLAVDIELYDVVQRLRFEHPAVSVVVVTGGLDKIFCAGANIQMLATSSHQHKVNFCKFTNETRNSIENASEFSGQTWIAAVNGTAAGGGYELALACEEILLVDDRSSAVSLPEVSLLAVLPGTGGLTRVVDKRHVRRDLADVFATRSEGVRAKQALGWGLVDHVAPTSEFESLIADRASHHAAVSDRPVDGQPIVFGPLDRTIGDNKITYEHVSVGIDRSLATATITLSAPSTAPPTSVEALEAEGANSWIIATARQFDDAMLHLRFNEVDIGTWIIETTGDPEAVLRAEEILSPEAQTWASREARLYWQRTFKRLDLSARTIVAIVEPGSCFVGIFAELFLAADRSYMLEGQWEHSNVADAKVQLTTANAGWFEMSNGLSRLETRFWQRPDALAKANSLAGQPLTAVEAFDAELVTFALDDIDWEDEVRVMLEERASFSPDALTGMEANYRFVGPETVETKIFGRLTAWQNWIFQRPNAVGPDGALSRFGSGARPEYDKARV